ncbi:MAG: class I SAM-dependent methyltransferase [Gammaproteobacteria bacterium]|jgi:trans-aconitate methyltransferase
MNNSMPLPARGGDASIARMPGQARKDFDKQYYDRFYGRKRPLRRDVVNTKKLCDFVCAYLNYIGQPVRSVLDLGCGLGLWRDALAEHFPKARYHGVEYSRYLCDEYGWEQASIVDYRTRTRADLVICQDTIQYLPDAEASRALRNLARLTRGALYLSAPSEKDWRETADPRISDADVYKRSAQWYRQRLKPSCFNLGGGLFLRRDAPVALWELERS